ncbi:hypothetical protein H072_4606 [Dactylellina haptotyla CBS 200.50]|uniref:Ubiquitin 3 binding protein But2 C-terminal domain-containing protein n=1 Tax=Dactylellina haptotyla (strain CBS 200.50) TaxID=1284197 RepID=S8AEW7_DACHA|nr:hypothetical protein H072_4606 [Dactylellina haptotyla CBS 200.50]
MQLTSILIPLLSLASTLNAIPLVSPEENAALEARAGNFVPPANPVFYITDFSNQGTPHSNRVQISFKVNNPTTKQTATCSYSSYQGVSGIAVAPFYTRCSTPGFGFGFELVQGGWVLTVEQKYSKDMIVEVGTVWLGDASNIKTNVNTYNPNGSFKYFDHLDYFTIRTNWWHK